MSPLQLFLRRRRGRRRRLEIGEVSGTWWLICFAMPRRDTDGEGNFYTLTRKLEDCSCSFRLFLSSPLFIFASVFFSLHHIRRHNSAKWVNHRCTNNLHSVHGDLSEFDVEIGITSLLLIIFMSPVLNIVSCSSSHVYVPLGCCICSWHHIYEIRS